MSPMRKIFLPMAANRGLRWSMVASSPPTMKINVPLAAPIFDPVMGASTYLTPLARRRSANFTVAEGEIVLESAMITPAASEGSAPSVPNNILSTAAVSETQSHTPSAPWAAAAGVGAMPAPSTILPGVRFQTVTSWPALTRFVAMACPMIPRPKKATRIYEFLLAMEGTFRIRNDRLDRGQANRGLCKKLHMDARSTIGV